MSPDRTTEAIQAMGGPGHATRIRNQTNIHVAASAENPDRSVQAATVFLLLPKIFGPVTIEGAEIEEVLGGLPPSLQRHFRRDRHARNEADIILSFDNRRIRGQDGKTVYVDNRGWTTYVSNEGPWDEPRRETNPLGAIYAAAQGIAECFNRAFEDAVPGARALEETRTYDIISASEGGDPRYNPSLHEQGPIETELLLAGAGAVGQAFIFAMGQLPDLKGRVEIVDHEVIEEENLDRYLLAFPENLNEPKARIARKHLAQGHPLLDVDANVPPPAGYTWSGDFSKNPANQASAANPGHNVSVDQRSPEFPLTRYQDWRGYDMGTPRPLVVTAVDSIQARRDIQFGLHRVVLNGWTDTGQNVMSFGTARHVIGQGPCMACPHHDTMDEMPDPVSINTEYTGLPRERVRELLEDPEEVPTTQEIREVADHRGSPENELLQRQGQPLHAVLQEVCGQSRLHGAERQGISPVGHVPLFVGIHLATRVVLESLDLEDEIPARVEGDVRQPPTGGSEVPPRAIKDKCLCQERRLQEHYEQLWG